MPTPETTIDGILNRRVALEQPAAGYRVAVDTVLLAAAVPAFSGDHILDLGCGAGGAMLALACRVPAITGLGIDIQGELVEICRRNIARNAFAVGLAVERADATQLSAALRGAFDHVLCNPPYHEESRHDVSLHAIKRTANTEKDGDLKLWIGAAAFALKHSGVLTLIHRADRRQEIIDCLRPSFGEIKILPILPKENTEPKRVIIRARRDETFSAQICAPFILHAATGGYTQAADAILRECQPLNF